MNEQFFANVLSIEETGTDNDEPEAASRFVSGDRNAGQPESELEKGNRKGTGGGHPCPVGKRAACAEPLLSGRMHADRNRRSDGAFHFPDFPDPFEGHLQTAEYFGKTAAVIRGVNQTVIFFLILSFLFNVLSIFAIILLYLRQNRFARAEQNVNKMVKEIEDIFSVYLMELKEENDAFIKK